MAIALVTDRDARLGYTTHRFPELRLRWTVLLAIRGFAQGLEPHCSLVAGLSPLSSTPGLRAKSGPVPAAARRLLGDSPRRSSSVQEAKDECRCTLIFVLPNSSSTLILLGNRQAGKPVGRRTTSCQFRSLTHCETRCRVVRQIEERRFTAQ